MTERNRKLIEQLKDRIEKKGEIDDYAYEIVDAIDSSGEISAIYEAHELIGEEVEFD